MNTLFHASLKKHKHIPSRQCLCNVQPMSIVSAHYHWQSLTFGYVCTSILVSFSKFFFCAPSFLRVSLSCFWMFLSLYFTLISVVSMLSSIWHVWLSLSFTHHKCHSSFSLNIVNVVFTHVRCHTLCIISFLWFQCFIFMKISWSYHVNTRHTISQSFKHYRTIVVKVIAKCIFSVALVVHSSQSFHIEGNMLLTCFGWSMSLCHQVF